MTHPDQEARADFEAWHAKEFWQPLDRDGDTYKNEAVRNRWVSFKAAWDRRQSAGTEAALKAILDEVEAHPLHTGCDYSQKELDDLGGDAATINLIAQTARNALKESK